MGGGRQIFQLLAGEDVDGDQVNLRVTVLASLGGRHFDDLARTALDDDVAVLPQSRALHGEGSRGAGVGGLEGVLMLKAQELALATPGQAPATVAHCLRLVLTCASLFSAMMKDVERVENMLGYR